MKKFLVFFCAMGLVFGLVGVQKAESIEESIEVSVDIEPKTCPNTLNLRSKGLLPVVILGTDEFDVNDVNIASIRLQIVVDPVHSSLEDVSTPVVDRQDVCDCTIEGGDGYADLTLKFDTQEIVDVVGVVNDGYPVPVTLTGELLDGTPIWGVDCVVILKKGKVDDGPGVPMDPEIVDTPDAKLVCEEDWTYGAGITGACDNDHCWKPKGDGSCTATWTPGLDTAGYYNVSGWWKSGGGARATNAKFYIHYAAGGVLVSDPIVVNMQTASEGWYDLGSYYFAAGATGYVVLSDQANGIVIADAIKLEAGQPPPPRVVVDKPPDADGCEDWNCGSGISDAYDNDHCWKYDSVDGSCPATWTPDIPQDGTYNVSAWWKSGGGARATIAEFYVHYDDGVGGIIVSDPITVNMQAGSGGWYDLGDYYFEAGTTGHKVVLSDQANGIVIADAIKFELQ